MFRTVSFTEDLSYPDTIELELAGTNLVNSCFEPEKLREYIKKACHWGGYSGISARVLSANIIEAIQVHFADALEILTRDHLNVGLALAEVIKIIGLSISFGSKHLRFFRPDICPILDSIVSEELGYALNTAGYKRYATDCVSVARFLEREAVNNPMNRGGNWSAGDVDMFVFSHLNDL